MVEMDELYHHGIKGQKWGVRRYQNKDGTLTPAGKKKYAKADKKWEKNASSKDTWVKVYNRAADKMNDRKTGISAYNKKFENIDLGKNAKAYEKYLKGYGKLWNNWLSESANEIIGTNPSGTKRGRAYTNEIGGLPIVEIVDIKE